METRKEIALRLIAKIKRDTGKIFSIDQAFQFAEFAAKDFNVLISLQRNRLNIVMFDYYDFKDHKVTRDDFIELLHWYHRKYN